MSPVMDSSTLIEEIKRRPILWDRRHASHNNKKVHDMHWDAIATVMGTKRESVKAKWKNLRDAYRKILKKAQMDGNPVMWMYYDQLSFIREQTLASRDRCRSVLYPIELNSVKYEVVERGDDEDGGADDDDAAEEFENSINSADEVKAADPSGRAGGGDGERDEAAAATPRSEDEHPAAVPSSSAGSARGFKRKLGEEDNGHGDKEMPQCDPDYQFLMSLLPHIKDVPLSRKLPLRMKIEAIVHEAAYIK